MKLIIGMLYFLSLFIILLFILIKPMTGLFDYKLHIGQAIVVSYVISFIIFVNSISALELIGGIIKVFQEKYKKYRDQRGIKNKIFM